MMTEPLWSPLELAEFLKVPVATIYQWHHRRVGPPAVRVGRHLRYRPEAVAAWLDKRQTAS
jgi:excisionase family DNA binding protein